LLSWKIGSPETEVIDVSKLSGDTIKFGATVTLTEEDTGDQKVWQIVGEPEADAHKGKISVTSPIAQALIGKTKDDTIEVDTPGGAKMYKVRRVERLERLTYYGKRNDARVSSTMREIGRIEASLTKR
jgi:transcription elongation GreA/GreB family factor